VFAEVAEVATPDAVSKAFNTELSNTSVSIVLITIVFLYPSGYLYLFIFEFSKKYYISWVAIFLWTRTGPLRLNASPAVISVIVTAPGLSQLNGQVRFHVVGIGHRIERGLGCDG